MNNLDRSNEKSVHNTELANKIRKQMFVFENSITMDDRLIHG